MLRTRVPCSREAGSALLKLLRLMRRGGGFWHVSLVLAGAAGSSGTPVAALQVRSDRPDVDGFRTA